MRFHRLPPAVKKTWKKDEAGFIYSYNVAKFPKAFIGTGCETGANMAARKRAKKRSSQTGYGLPVPEGLHEAIEIERGNLAKAESVLGCLIASMEYEADSADRPYYPDVAELARDLVKQSIKGLDSLVLQRRLLRDKVREHLDLRRAEDAYPVSYH
jgi:hypothetical protein